MHPTVRYNITTGTMVPTAESEAPVNSMQPNQIAQITGSMPFYNQMSTSSNLQTHQFTYHANGYQTNADANSYQSATPQYTHTIPVDTAAPQQFANAAQLNSNNLSTYVASPQLSPQTIFPAVSAMPSLPTSQLPYSYAQPTAYNQPASQFVNYAADASQYTASTVAPQSTYTEASVASAYNQHTVPTDANQTAYAAQFANNSYSAATVAPVYHYATPATSETANAQPMYQTAAQPQFTASYPTQMYPLQTPFAQPAATQMTTGYQPNAYTAAAAQPIPTIPNSTTVPANTLPYQASAYTTAAPVQYSAITAPTSSFYPLFQTGPNTWSVSSSALPSLTAQQNMLPTAPTGAFQPLASPAAPLGYMLVPIPQQPNTQLPSSVQQTVVPQLDAAQQYSSSPSAAASSDGNPEVEPQQFQSDSNDVNEAEVGPADQSSKLNPAAKEYEYIPGPLQKPGYKFSSDLYRGPEADEFEIDEEPEAETNAESETIEEETPKSTLNKAAAEYVPGHSKGKGYKFTPALYTGPAGDQTSASIDNYAGKVEQFDKSTVVQMPVSKTPKANNSLLKAVKAPAYIPKAKTAETFNKVAVNNEQEDKKAAASKPVNQNPHIVVATSAAAAPTTYFNSVLPHNQPNALTRPTVSVDIIPANVTTASTQPQYFPGPHRQLNGSVVYDRRINNGIEISSSAPSQPLPLTSGQQKVASIAAYVKPTATAAAVQPNGHHQANNIASAVTPTATVNYNPDFANGLVVNPTYESAESHYKSGRLAKTLEVINALFTLNPQQPGKVYILLAKAVEVLMRFNNSNPEHALFKLEHALGMKPTAAKGSVSLSRDERIEAMMIYARIKYKNFNTEDAKATCQAIYKMDPNHEDAKTMLGIIEFENGNYKETARLLADVVVNKQKNKASAYKMVAELLDNMQGSSLDGTSIKTYIEELRRHLNSYSPEDQESVKYLISLLNYKTNDYQAADAYLNQDALKQTLDDHLGIILRLKLAIRKNPTEGLKLLNIVRARGGNVRGIIEKIANELTNENAKNQALILLGFLIKEMPEARIMLNRAKVLLSIGEYGKAIKDCVYVLKHLPDPSNVLAANNMLARIYFDAGDFQQAEQVCTVLCQPNHSKPESGNHFLLACIYAATGQHGLMAEKISQIRNLKQPEFENFQKNLNKFGFNLPRLQRKLTKLPHYKFAVEVLTKIFEPKK